jgi:hypothetical protein
MPDTHVTIVGNLTDDPEVSFTPTGAAVCNFRLAVTARIKDGESWRDGDTSFYRITAWRGLAEHIGDSYRRATGSSSWASSGPGAGRPPRGSAAPWSRSRPKRSAPACGGPSPSPSLPPTASPARASSTTTRPSDPGEQ